MAAPSLFELAVQFHKSGDGARAEGLYRQVLEQAPEHGDAMFLLSVLALQAGRVEEAVALRERAVRVAPENAAYLSNLGDIYRCVGRRAEAVGVQLMAIARKPDFAEAVFNLALTFEEQGNLDAATACYERALEQRPGLRPAADRLASVKGKRELAAGVVSAAAAQGPAPAMTPAEGLAALGETLRLAGRTEDAAAWFHIALKLDPTLPTAHLALGAIHADAGRFDEAIAEFRRTLELDAEQHDARSYLAGALGELGRREECEALYREAIARRPDDANAHSALIFNLQFWPNVSAADILAEARAWNARHARPLAAEARPHDNERSPERRLRIGYVSPDFKTHVLALFTIPLLEHHDHGQFEIYCYSSADKPDHLTERIRGYADVFRDVRALDDAALAELIREDRIDILVDITMHMTDRRLLCYARRPAPVQLCWLAYPGTTGLETLDYRISDPFLDPPDARTDDAYSEETLRLPDTFWCYDPLTAELDVSPLPALTTGRVTFGCLNHFRKVNDGVLRVWAQVLAAVPGSRLLLMAPPGSARDRVRATFQEEGIEPERVELVDRFGRLDYLRQYRELDLGLDTFPYNGHTTSLDGLWMGVPTITLAGETVVGRAGVCHALNLGLPELIAKTPQEFVRVASSLAGDLDRLAELRRTLRGRMQQSPLMDAPRFARNFESVYRAIWRRWCEKK